MLGLRSTGEAHIKGFEIRTYRACKRRGLPHKADPAVLMSRLQAHAGNRGIYSKSPKSLTM